MTTSPAPGWRSYASGRMLAVLVLGFSSGLPLFKRVLNPRGMIVYR